MEMRYSLSNDVPVCFGGGFGAGAPCRHIRAWLSSHKAEVSRLRLRARDLEADNESVARALRNGGEGEAKAVSWRRIEPTH